MVSGGPGGPVWDVVVVGSGPAGAQAARAAAEAGADTLLLDRARFPRYKTCGGGLIGASLAALPTDMSIPERDAISTVQFTHRGRWSRARHTDVPVFRMVNRDEFDEALNASAVKAGATFRDGVRVTGISDEPDHVAVTTGDDVIRARAVVGADGSASRVGKHVGVECELVDLGLEMELAVDGDVADRWRGVVHLDWGPLPGSYAWVFPKGDRLTVGVIASKGNPDETRAYLKTFVSQMELDGLEVVRDSGHLTRCRTESSPLSRGRVLVAGDAAGFLDPWTREGISFALRSGAAAGRAAAAVARATDDDAVRAAAAGYTAEMHGTLVEEMRAGARCLQAFTSLPSVFHVVLARSQPGWRAFVRVGLGETSLARLVRQRIVRGALRLIPG